MEREKDMGMFKVHVKVANPANPDLFFEEDFWVDTGAMYSFIPENRMKEIGVNPSSSREVILADGRHDRRLLGEALVTIPILNETLTNQIVFGPNDSLYLLGAMSLEAFAVEPDPVGRRLKPIAAIIGGFIASR